jgi:hypothetical protein
MLETTTTTTTATTTTATATTATATAATTTAATAATAAITSMAYGRQEEEPDIIAERSTAAHHQADTAPASMEADVQEDDGQVPEDYSESQAADEEAREDDEEALQSGDESEDDRHEENPVPNQDDGDGGMEADGAGEQEPNLVFDVQHVFAAKLPDDGEYQD